MWPVVEYEHRNGLKRVLRSTGNFLTELPLLSLGGLCSMELDVVLYRVCVSEVSATALFLCKMGYALSSCDVVTF